MADDVVTWVAFNGFFDECGVERLSYEAFKQKFCLPCSDFLIRMDVPENAVRNFTSIFNPLYLESLDQLTCFPDVKDCLDSLKERGVKLGLVSATPSELLWPTLEKLELVGFFEVITGDAPKPSPLPIYQACTAIGTSPRQVAYCGDMEEDISCAKRAGAVSIGICRKNGSYQDRARLEAQNPKYIVSNLQELLNLVAKER